MHAKEIPVLTRNVIRLLCFLGAACLLFLLFGSCAPVVEDHDFSMASPAPLPCRSTAGAFLDALDNQVAVWNQAELRAAQASSLELVAPLNELRAIRTQVEALEAPSCAWNLRSSAASFMGEVIRAYDLVMTDQPQDQIDLAWQTASLKKDYFELDYVATRGEQEE
jgi:hypothetical protein